MLNLWISLKYFIIFQSRFENTEQRLTSLQHDYNKVENERDIMADSLKRFYSVTTHAVTLHKVKVII